MASTNGVGNMVVIHRPGIIIKEDSCNRKENSLIMNKILSLIIPTYNMAELLPRCLDSIIASGVNESIEAIVVNDGSKDNSLEIAKKYEEQHPECITVIDKPNGNYGSTINAALPVAKGKYVKILHKIFL